MKTLGFVIFLVGRWALAMQVVSVSWILVDFVGL
jgi:hypothetical protein